MTRSTRCRPTSRGLLDNVAIVVEDEPPPEEDLLGLYHGIPQTDRTSAYGGVLPDLIHDLSRAPSSGYYGRDQALLRAQVKAHRAARDRPPLRDQRRAPRRDRPLLEARRRSWSAPRAGASWTVRSSALPAAGTTRPSTASHACSTRPRPGSTRSSASSPAGRSSRGAGLVRGRRPHRRRAAVPEPGSRLGGPRLGGDRVRLSAPARPLCEAGRPRARAGRGEELGLAAPPAARLRVRGLRPRRRPVDRPRPRPLLRGARGAVPADPGRRRAAAVRRRTFDVAFCVATLHHALDLQAMVGELARVTRRGGVVAGAERGDARALQERREPRAGAREGARHQRARPHDVGVRVGFRAGRPAAGPARVRAGPGGARASGTSRASCCARDDCRRRCGR